MQRILYSCSPIFKVQSFARSVATDGKLTFRQATLKDADILTRRALQVNGNIGPYDYHTFISFDPKSYYIGEINGEIVAQFGMTEFPNHHYFGGGIVISEKHRLQGLARQCFLRSFELCDKNYTVGGDVFPNALPMLEEFGCKRYWDTCIASLSFEHVVKTLAMSEQYLNSTFIQPLHDVNLYKLLQYDAHVFGASRKTLMQRWFNTPGSFGFVAHNKDSNKITGYTVLKQIIRRGGTETGLVMAPLYADSVEIAKLLIKHSAEVCLASPPVPKTDLWIFHSVGNNCGEGAPELMRELDAKFSHISYRVYTKGIPPGRQMQKIYGIPSGHCD